MIERVGEGSSVVTRFPSVNDVVGFSAVSRAKRSDPIDIALHPDLAVIHLNFG